MCTVIVLNRVLPSHPIVVAGNRDEFLVRSSLAPHVWALPKAQGRTRIFAGKDQKEGGTWFGINQDGLVVGVTNLYTGHRDVDKLSRGQLVLKCLAVDSVDRALDILTPGEVSQYNPFNLFCLSEETGFVVTHDARRFRRIPLDPGVHVLTNRVPDDPGDAKRLWLSSRLRDLPYDPDGAAEHVAQALAFHGNGSPAPVCVHLPGYGTVSSCIAFLGPRRERNRYLYADGPPCQNRFQDLTREFLTLFSTKE